MSGRKKDIDRARMAAARVVHAVAFESAFSNESAAYHLASPDLDARDRAFASALIFGTLSNRPLIDYYLSRASSRSLDKLDKWVITILRTGVWQLFFSYHVPQRSAVDESVKLARFFVGERATGFVNAVMRGLIRRKPPLSEDSGRALTCGLTPELFEMLSEWYGEDQAAAIGHCSLLPPDCVPVRMNALRRKAFLEWASGDEARALGVRKLDWPDAAYGIEPAGHNVTRLQPYRDGLFSLQSQSAMLVGSLSGVSADDRVLDLCAAPGGKITHIAELKGNDRGLTACDISEERLRSLDDLSRRLGFSAIERRCLDAADHHEAFDSSFDIVLCDVPCTGLGLLQRRPEIRSRVTRETAGRLLPIQRAILRNGSRAVVPGGVLMYSTCTINPAENEDQIRDFLGSCEGKAFEAEHITTGLPSSSRMPGTLLLLPHLAGSDGFFIARLRRKA